MKPPARLSVAAAAVAFLAAVGALYTAWDALSAGDAGQRLQDGLRRSRELDDRLARVWSIQAAKNDVAAGVIAGRLTLLEAAAEFQAMELQNPDFHWGMFRTTLPGGSDGERFCRLVIRQVDALLAHRPRSEAEPVLSRLEAELRAHLREHGTVTLPPR